MSDEKTFTVLVESAPTITSFSLSNGQPVISWSSISGQSYQLQQKKELLQTNWTESLPPVHAVTNVASQIDSGASASQQFYRIRVLP